MITISLNDCFDAHCCISLDLCFLQTYPTLFNLYDGCKNNVNRATLPCECAKLPQSYLTLCNLMDYSPPGSLSMGFSRQKYWSGLPCPPPGDLPDPRTGPVSLMSPALAGRFFTTSATYGPPKREGTVSQVFFCFPSQANSRLSRKQLMNGHHPIFPLKHKGLRHLAGGGWGNDRDRIRQGYR